MERTVESDKGLGLGLAFSLLAIVAGLAMLGGPTELVRAWGFAAATGAGVLAVVAIHVYGA